MSDIEMIVAKTRELEQLLKEQYHAQGQGIEQLISSCEERLPHSVVPQLRYIATMKNKVVLEDSFELADEIGFLQVYKDCILKLTPRSNRFIWRLAFLLMMIMTAASLLFYYINWDYLEPHIFR